MRVARRRHRQTARLRVFEGVIVVAPQRGGGVEDLERVDRQRLEGFGANAGAEEIVRMRRNREAAVLVDDLADFARRLAFHDGQGRADAKEVAFVGRDLHARE